MPTRIAVITSCSSLHERRCIVTSPSATTRTPRRSPAARISSRCAPRALQLRRAAPARRTSCETTRPAHRVHQHALDTSARGWRSNQASRANAQTPLAAPTASATSLRSPLWRRHPPPRNQLGQVAVASRFCASNTRTRRPDRGRRDFIRRDVEIRPDDERQPFRLRRDVHARRACKRAFVGDRDPAIAELDRALDQFLRMRRAMQERKVRTAEQFRVIGQPAEFRNHHRSPEQAVQEPARLGLAPRPLLEHPVARAGLVLRDAVIARSELTVEPPGLDPLHRRHHPQRRMKYRPLPRINSGSGSASNQAGLGGTAGGPGAGLPACAASGSQRFAARADDRRRAPRAARCPRRAARPAARTAARASRACRPAREKIVGRRRDRFDARGLQPHRNQPATRRARAARRAAA